MFILFIIIFFTLVYIWSNKEKFELTDEIRKLKGSAFIKLSDGITHYELIGPESGPLIVMIHGITIPSWTWDPHIEGLAAHGYRVLRYDMYGRGFSDRPDIPYNRELLVRQLKELLDELKITGNIILMGSSMGAGIATCFASKYPDHVGKLVLISPAVIKYKVPLEGLFRIKGIGEYLIVVLGVPIYIKRTQKSFKDTPNYKKYIDLFIEQVSFKGFAFSGLSAIRNDLSKSYENSYKIVGKQNKDVLILWGEKDAEITKNEIDIAKKLIPHAKIITIPNVGHGAKIHYAPETDNEIITFLGSSR